MMVRCSAKMPLQATMDCTMARTENGDGSGNELLIFIFALHPPLMVAAAGGMDVDVGTCQHPKSTRSMTDLAIIGQTKQGGDWLVFNDWFE